MTRIQVRKEQADFLKNHADPCPLNFYIQFNYRRKSSGYGDYKLRLDKALQDDPTSEKLLGLMRNYNNNNYKDDWEQYENWKKNRKANVCCRAECGPNPTV